MPESDFSCSKGKSTYSGIVLPKIERDEAKYFAKMSTVAVDNNLYNKIVNKYK